jgi:hypothetical protein
MAAFGRAAAALPPDYRHEPSKVVPLAFPFALDGAKVERVALAPPTLDGLEFLRGKGGLSARTILLVTSTLSLRAIGALRWPDVESLLGAALDLLPPDLVPTPGEGTATAPVPAEAVDTDVSAQLGLDPGDFAISL